jgi:hypothetical protein
MVMNLVVNTSDALGESPGNIHLHTGRVVADSHPRAR